MARNLGLALRSQQKIHLTRVGAQSSLKFLFLADKSGTRCGLQLLEKIHLKFALSVFFFFCSPEL